MKFWPLAVWVTLLAGVMTASAQTTMFSYQGQLNASNAAANGLYDFQFQLVNTNADPVSAPLTNAPVAVTNGFFNTTLDFGSSVFNGSNLWLQVGVRNYGNTNAYTLLSPLQQITSVPYAIRAINAANASNAMFLTVPLQATNLSGIIAVSNLPANVAFLNSNETFSGVVNLNNTGNTYSGNGSALFNLSAGNLLGIIPNFNLNTNVAFQTNSALNFAGSVAATNFIGAGHGLTNVPGAFFWVTVSGSSAPANPNVGYICTNNTTPVTITLPASPSVGDTYKVAGIGDAGWIVAQNTNQQIFAGNLSSSVGQTWNPIGPFSTPANWTAIACSSDGTKLFAAQNGYYIYPSTNSGASWTEPNTTPGYWSGIACSADGTHLIACAGYSPYNVQSGPVYYSSNTGQSWTQYTGAGGSPGSAEWSGVASSANGNTLIAVSRNAGIYLSTSGGSSWTTVTGSSSYLWNSVASSASGAVLVAADGGGYMTVSTNSGAKWTTYNFGGIPWYSVACSADGARMVATASTGAIYLSTDYGVIWSQENSPVSGSLNAVVSSADGSRLAAVVGGTSTANTGSIYGSINSGGTWNQLAGAPTLSWSSIASSADGSILAAAAYGGNIYLSSQNSTTTGTTGYLFGAQHSVIELLYVGNNQFLPLSSEGTIRAY